MKYGKDYGIKVYTPWYIRCPLINRLFNTMKVEISLTTFSSDGGPMIGVRGEFRIPFYDHGTSIVQNVGAGYCFPREDHSCGNGLYVKASLLDINHRKVRDKKDPNIPLSAGGMAKAKELQVWFGMWCSSLFQIKFAKKDYIQVSP